jgi:hypothetical protein
MTDIEWLQWLLVIAAFGFFLVMIMIWMNWLDK